MPPSTAGVQGLCANCGCIQTWVLTSNNLSVAGMVARGCEAQDGLPPGATMQCTLDPPKPKLEMAMRPPFQGVASVTTWQEHVTQSARLGCHTRLLCEALAITLVLRAGCHRSESRVSGMVLQAQTTSCTQTPLQEKQSAPGGSLLSGYRCWGWGCCSADSLG